MTGHDDEHEPLVSVGDSVKEYSNGDTGVSYRVSAIVTILWNFTILRTINYAYI